MPVRFTNRGDTEAVKYNFFKMCFSLLGRASFSSPGGFEA